MTYLYHRVPRNLQGDTLHPLNEMKVLLPDVYKEATKKYEGREQVMEQVIPHLECKWNDVLHMSAVHPREIEKALGELGIEMKGRDFYEIDPQLLEKEKTIVYLYTSWKGVDTLKQKDQFVPFEIQDIEKYSVLPQVTKEYYKRMTAEGGKLLFWHLVPHILYKGTLKISDLKRFTI